MSLPIPEEYDATWVIVLKIVITVVTLVIVAVTSIGEGFKILQRRKRRGPSMGFNKE